MSKLRSLIKEMVKHVINEESTNYRYEIIDPR